MIGQIAAINNPKDIISLCLLSTSPTNQFDKELDPLPESFYKPVEKMMVKAALQKAMRWVFLNNYLDTLTDIFMYLLKAEENERKIIYSYFKQMHTWGGYNIKSAQGFAYVNQKSRVNMLENIKVPTLILHGSRDNFFSMKHIQVLNKGIENSKLIIIENGLHAIPVSMYHNYISNIIELLKNA